MILAVVRRRMLLVLRRYLTAGLERDMREVMRQIDKERLVPVRVDELLRFARQSLRPVFVRAGLMWFLDRPGALPGCYRPCFFYGCCR